MKMRSVRPKYRIPIILLILVFSFVKELSAQEYGLYFTSHDSLKDQRTGLDLFPQQKQQFKKDFKLSFDLSLHENVKFSYGYIFRIVINDEKNIDLIFSDRSRLNKNFTIVDGFNQTSIGMDYDLNALYEDWLTIDVHFNLLEDKLALQIQDSILTHEHIGFTKNAEVKIYFGACNKQNYSTTDTPPIRVRDIKIEENSKLRHHWPLNEISGHTATDIISNTQAKVMNPVWLMHKHLYWTKEDNLCFSGISKFVVDDQTGEIYFIEKDILIRYNPATKEKDSLLLKANILELGLHHQLFKHDDLLYTYNPNNEEVCIINSITGEVSTIAPNTTTRKHYLHHNKLFHPKDSSLYILNGYGHYSYKNEMLKFNIADRSFESINGSGDLYEPRYLSAGAYLNDTLYILGGYGSVTGNQKVNPQYFYDFNAIALSNYNYEQKWELDQPESDYCFSNSLIIDSTTRQFHTLKFSKQTYNSQLQLVKGSIDKKGLTHVGNSIAYKFNDINSFADLYFNSALNKIFAITAFSKDYISTDIEIYSIQYPPITMLQEFNNEKPAPIRAIYSLLAILLIASALTVFILRKKKIAGFEHSEIEEKKTPPIEPLELEKKNRANAIYFFGGFQVISNEGVDITKKFTQLIKELFLLIIFNSIGKSKGISSDKIIEYLWFHKSLKSGRNNLSVNIAKLKDILKDLDGISLNHETSYWKATIDSQTLFVEYQQIHRALESSKSKLPPEAIRVLLSAANNGQFLLNLSYEWLDSYKAQISDQMVDTLISFAESLQPQKDATLITQICDGIFHFDTINEEAMALKCKTQSQLGKHSLAKRSYEAFAKEYFTLYGEKFKRSFNSVINDSSD